MEVDAVSGWPSQKLNLQSWQHIRRDRPIHSSGCYDDSGVRPGVSDEGIHVGAAGAETASFKFNA